MTKTQNSLLNTPLRSPVTFLGAPRNPVPEQEIPPLPTPRVFPRVSAPWDENDPSRAFSAACAASAAARETTAPTRRFTKAIGWFANAFSSSDGAFCHTHAYAEIEAHEVFFIEVNREA